jgi:hypothetical protein
MTRRTVHATVLTIALAVVALLVATPRHVSTQGYSFAAPYPNVAAHAVTGLQVDYSGGAIVSGGLVTTITGSNVTATNSLTNCQAPLYPSCNFVYWPGSGASLSLTTSAATAYAAGNVVVAFVTTTGGNIVAVTPATLNVPDTRGITSYIVPPSACQSFVSGNATGTQGLTVAGASSTYVVQAQTSASGTNTHTYQCNITPPLVPSSIVDATFFYGVQTTTLGTQAVVLASGTLNSQIVFTSITYPAAGASETPSTVTPVRADSGSLTLTPVAASVNVATTTAGAFYSQLFSPASAIAVTTNLTQVFLNVALLNTATSATITNSPGVLVRYTR